MSSFVIFRFELPGGKPGSMSVDRIVCLANSYKHNHRCVAGISLVTKKWIRLAGERSPAASP